MGHCGDYLWAGCLLFEFVFFGGEVKFLKGAVNELVGAMLEMVDVRVVVNGLLEEKMEEPEEGQDNLEIVLL